MNITNGQERPNSDFHKKIYILLWSYSKK